MRAPFPALLPIVAATALALAGGDAKAVTIRYSFLNPTGGVTGGTIQVASLNQALNAAGILNFTVDKSTGTDTVAAPYGIATSTQLSYQASSPFQVWNLNSFDFAGVSPTTQWSQLLNRTFTAGATPVFSWDGGSLASSGAISADAISFSEVPGPLPALGAAAAFGWSRRLRKRIQAPPQPAARH